VWNLTLHGTNSIVISDAYNILHGLYLDCASLTLTTNGPGSQSAYGELNLQNSTVGWAAATPNLRYLTNNGEILLPLTGANSLGIFGSAPSPYGALINNGLIWDDGSQIWASNFVNTGEFYNGLGPFTLQSQSATLTGGFAGGYLYADGDVSIATSNLMAGDYLLLEADRSLTITATNQLADTGVTDGSVWYVGLASVGNGIKVPVKPSGGSGAYGNSLLGTTINLYAPSNRIVANVWAGTDYGATPAGYTNNLAVGQLILDSYGVTNNTRFTFTGAGVSNAIYVDYLELVDQATNRDSIGNAGALNISSNLVIYYAQAVINGVSAARKLNHKNNDHLRWVPTYAGYFSSTNIVNGGVTNTFNIALAQDTQIDSDGDGIPNSIDPTPFFVSSEMDLNVYPTNHPANTIAISWNSVPQATNSLFYSTNLLSWRLLTNIYIQTNPFVSVEPYPGPATNITVFDPVTVPGRFYKVTIYPWLTYPY
jgi:hypothetical protein